MQNAIDLEGKVFGRLTVINLDNKTNQYKRYWVCKCECGGEKTVREDHLIYGETMSCGCAAREIIVERNKKMKKYPNGYREARKERQDSKSTPRDRRINNIWYLMRRRCNDPADKAYKYYGGRGIKICESWFDYYKFEEWALSSGYSKELTIDRIDNNGNYSPDNCRWVTRKEQSHNTRKFKPITINGETHGCNEWREITGHGYKTLLRRV